MIKASRSTSFRRAYTLIELTVSMVGASALMVGLGSCLFIAGEVFDGNTAAEEQSRVAEVQADMLVDLNQATSFSLRTASAVTFTVPDRNHDQLEDTLSYSWTGLPTAELRFSQNAGPAATLLENVQAFNLTYLDRFMVNDTTLQSWVNSEIQIGVRTQHQSAVQVINHAEDQ